jgi:hypothetical protein
MIGCKEISGIRSKKCKFLLVERQGNRHYLLVYAKSAACEMQYNTLRMMRLRAMRVPKVVQMADNEILLDYIEGNTLYEDISAGAVFKFSMLATALAKFLQDFCTYNPDKRMGDIDLRSYIVRGSVLYGFDFDCIIKGTYAEAIADAVCSVLSEPKIAKDRQLAFCRHLYLASHLTKEEMVAALDAIMPLCNGLSVGKEELLKSIL